MPKQSTPGSAIASREWGTAAEIDKAVQKLERRIAELSSLDIEAAERDKTGAVQVATSNLRDTIRDVFGPNSPEFAENKYRELWSGPIIGGMSDRQRLATKEAGKQEAIGILRGLIGRLAEKREELAGSSAPTPKAFLEYLSLHPRISDVAAELFEDGHHWEAVFAASKALVNLVKERSGRHDLDGAPLMRTVFSRNDPILAFNELKNQTDLDEQEGMMHLFEGAVLGIRNPGGHAFPEGPERRAVEYLSLISLLAHRAQEATKRKRP
jgi:uncharacterized protein (TIGR02391 family)